MTFFDRKFGKDFLSSVPSAPGVYRFLGEDGRILYIGKARDLRRRLAQYRKPGRAKRHLKRRQIVKAASTITWEICATELDACLQEMRAIQSIRPEMNVAGAFSFLYPFVGMRADEEGRIFFLFTTHPEAFANYQMFGVFRSRDVVGEAFFALMRLLKFVGHAEAPSALRTEPQVEHSYLFCFRRVAKSLLTAWDLFFKGESREALENLSLNLLDRSAARARSEEVQQDLKSLARFYKTEAAPLSRVIRETAYPTYPVPQIERDILFLRARESS